MDLHKILRELYEERERLDQAIVAMERLALAGNRRRGRPPKWLKEARERKRSDMPDKKKPPTKGNGGRL